VIETAFVHRRKDRNIGDRACTPGNYFDFGTHELYDFADELPSCERLIIGGGQVFQQCLDTAIRSLETANKRVVWGIGISPMDRRSVAFDILQGCCDLIATRNHGIRGCEYVPCASAMSPLFDAPPEPERELVLFYHARKSKDVLFDSGVPAQGNDQGNMADAVAFLASGATVVTNSYHGTYWAMCLGRRVLCLPFNKKFLYFPENPQFASSQNWLKHVKEAQARPQTLEQARDRNKSFYEKVRNL